MSDVRGPGALLRPISEVARELRIAPDHIESYGSDKAKVRLDALHEAEAVRSPGKLILVSAITPTPAGEGKTTTSIGLSQGLHRIGKRSALALRQPSMGPVFGRKGGLPAAVRASSSPPTRSIFSSRAISTRSRLRTIFLPRRSITAFTSATSISTRRRWLWKRVLDMNDRCCAHIVIGLGGSSQGVPRESGFDITAASEVMAILCLARLARRPEITAGTNPGRVFLQGEPVLAGEIGVIGALTAILNEALMPNLVQTTESTPAFVHGGPFANIAHGCNSILATRMALAMSDYAVTEAGFAFDLGGEKFFDLKCRSAGLNPAAIVLVATIRALKMHGGVELGRTNEPNPAAVERGLENLAAHLDGAANFQKPIVVAINRFTSDTMEECKIVHDIARPRRRIRNRRRVRRRGRRCDRAC